MEHLKHLNSSIFLIRSHSSQEQQRLREKQKMLKNDWERFKQQRKEIESSLMEKPQAGGGGWVHSLFDYLKTFDNLSPFNSLLDNLLDNLIDNLLDNLTI